MSQSAANYRRLALELNHPLHVSFASLPSISAWSNLVLERSFLSSALPSNLHLQSLQILPDNSVLLRLHHPFAAGEDPVHSQPVTVNLTSLFSDWTVEVIAETNLTGAEVIPTCSHIELVANCLGYCDERASHYSAAPNGIQDVYYCPPLILAN